MSTSKGVGLAFVVVLGIMLYLWCMGQYEMKWLMNQDIGWIVMSVGVLVLLASFFNLGSEFHVWYLRLYFGSIVFIFGMWWYLYGIGLALLFTSLYVLVPCGFLSAMSTYYDPGESNVFNKYIWMIIPVFFLGVLLFFTYAYTDWKLLGPTKEFAPQTNYEQDTAECTNAVWRLSLEYRTIYHRGTDHPRFGGPYYHDVGTFTGTESNAYLEVFKRFEIWQKDTNSFVSKVELDIISIPESYKREKLWDPNAI